MLKNKQTDHILINCHPGSVYYFVDSYDCLCCMWLMVIQFQIKLTLHLINFFIDVLIIAVIYETINFTTKTVIIHQTVSIIWKCT